MLFLLVSLKYILSHYQSEKTTLFVAAKKKNRLSKFPKNQFICCHFTCFSTSTLASHQSPLPLTLTRVSGKRGRRRSAPQTSNKTSILRVSVGFQYASYILAVYNGKRHTHIYTGKLVRSLSNFSHALHSFFIEYTGCSLILIAVETIFGFLQRRPFTQFP